MSKLKLAELAPIIEPYIMALNTEQNRQLYRDRKFHNADKVKDINTRFRFDVLYAIPSSVRNDFYSKAYKLGNDKHISSLLKSMIADLT